MTNHLYLVEEYIENEPTGRCWRVTAVDPVAAAFQAVDKDQHVLAEEEPFRFKVSPRNCFGQSQFVNISAPAHG